MRDLLTERIARRALIAIALAGLVLGVLAWANGNNDLANWCWATGTVPVVIVLFFSMLRDFFAGRFGVDTIAFLSMATALVLGQNLTGIIIAIMYAGGNVLEDFAIARAERDLRSLINRAPRIAHVSENGAVHNVPVDNVK